MGHAAFVVTYPEYVEAISEEPQQYIDFYGNVSFSSAFVAIIIVRVTVTRLLGVIYSLVKLTMKNSCRKPDKALTIDYCSRKVRNQHRSFHIKVVAFGTLALLCVFISSARYIMQWTLDERFIKANVISFLISVPLLLSQQSVFVRCNFPVEFFGLLSGLSRTMMSISTCLLFVSPTIIAEYGLSVFYKIIFVFEIITIIFPISLLYRKLYGAGRVTPF